MRTFECGRYPAQQADFHARSVYGSSVYVDRGTNTRDAGTQPYDDSVILMNNFAGTTYDVYRTMIELIMARTRAALGHTPVILSAELRLSAQGAQVNTVGVFNLALYRLLTHPDLADCDQRYYDVSLTLPWGGDEAIYAPVYAPVPGVDYLATPFSAIAVPTSIAEGAEYPPFDITAELAYVLQANTDFWAMLTYVPIGTPFGSTAFTFFANWKTPSGFPYIRVRYMNPLEFFGCQADGSIDLLKLLDNSTGLDLNSLYLGAVEVGQLGTPVACMVKNIGTRSLPHVEIWDDSPEWTTPAAGTANTGTAALDHVVLADASSSQKYTVKFTSATAFQVLAQAYKDNTADLNPSYGTTGWTGAIGSDWIAPSGGLVIPAAAWSGTPVATDTFVVYVTGNSTNAAWASDSNTQIEIAKDNGSAAPDDTTWRPIRGQRTMLTGAVTIDATSKTLAVRYIDTAAWPTGTKVYVANASTIDEGVIAGQTATSLDITFPSATGHTYAAGDRVCTTLPLRGLAPSLWAKTTGAAGASQPNPAYIALAGAAALGFTTGQTCSIQDVTDPTLTETFVVSAADSVRILATGYLTHDYPAGAMIVAGGTGEGRVWLRIVASATTLEERKQLRLAVRT